MLVAGGDWALQSVCPFQELSVPVLGDIPVSPNVPSSTGFEPSASPGKTPFSPSFDHRRKSARDAMGVTRVLHRKSRLDVVRRGPFQLRDGVSVVRRLYFLWAR